jgi:hypothetical protein
MQRRSLVATGTLRFEAEKGLGFPRRVERGGAAGAEGQAERTATEWIQ